MHAHQQKLSWHLKTSNSIYKLYTISQNYAKHQIYQETDFHDISNFLSQWIVWSNQLLARFLLLTKPAKLDFLVKYTVQGLCSIMFHISWKLGVSEPRYCICTAKSSSSSIMQLPLVSQKKEKVLKQASSQQPIIIELGVLIKKKRTTTKL